MYKGYYNGVVSPLQYMQAGGTLTEQLAKKIGSENEILRYQYFLISYRVFTVGIWYAYGYYTTYTILFWTPETLYLVLLAICYTQESEFDSSLL